MESAISVRFCEEKLRKESASLAVAILLLFIMIYSLGEQVVSGN
jgi:hypothetical protein